MFVDMGQADASLYRKPSCAQFQVDWLRAIDLAAKEMYTPTSWTCPTPNSSH